MSNNGIQWESETPTDRDEGGAVGAKRGIQRSFSGCVQGASGLVQESQLWAV